MISGFFTGIIFKQIINNILISIAGFSRIVFSYQGIDFICEIQKISQVDIVG